jgi:hypothetical protein
VKPGKMRSWAHVGNLVRSLDWLVVKQRWLPRFSLLLLLSAPGAFAQDGGTSSRVSAQPQICQDPPCGGGSGGGTGGSTCTGSNPCDLYCQTPSCIAGSWRCTNRSGSCTRDSCYTGMTCSVGTCGGGTHVATPSGDATKFVVSGLYTNTVTTGVSATFVIAAYTASNAYDSSYNGAVRIAVSGTGITSTLPVNATLSSGSVTISGKLTASSAPGAATISVDGNPQSSCDPDPTGSGVITVAAAPVTPTITLNQAALNSGATGSATSSPAQPTGVSYAWSFTPSSAGAVVGSNSGQSVSYTVASTNPATLTLNVQNGASPAQIATANANITVCSSPALAFNNTKCITGSISPSSPVTVGTQTSIGWTGTALPSGSNYQIVSGGSRIGTCPPQNPTMANVSSLGSTSYSLVATTSCASTSGVTVATNSTNGIDAPAAVSITTAPEALAGATGQYASVPPQSGMTYAWTVGHAGITTNGGPYIYFTAGSLGSSTLQVRVTNAAGSFVDSATVTIATPTTLPNTVQTLTQGSQNTISWSAPTTLPPGYIYQLTGPPTTTCYGTSPGTYTYTVPLGVVSYSLVATTACNTAGLAVGTAIVQGMAPPMGVTITAPRIVLPSQTGIVASVTYQANMAYSWTVVGATITGTSNGGSAVTITAGSSPSAALGVHVSNGATDSGSFVDSPPFTMATPTVTVNAPSNVVAGVPFSVTWTGSQLPTGFKYNLLKNGLSVSCGSTNSASVTDLVTETVTFSIAVTTDCGLLGTVIASAPNQTHVWPIPDATISLIVPGGLTAAYVGENDIVVNVAQCDECTYTWSTNEGFNEPYGLPPTGNVAPLVTGSFGGSAMVGDTMTVSVVVANPGNHSNGSWSILVGCAGPSLYDLDNSCIAGFSCDWFEGAFSGYQLSQVPAIGATCSLSNPNACAVTPTCQYAPFPLGSVACIGAPAPEGTPCSAGTATTSPATCDGIYPACPPACLVGQQNCGGACIENSLCCDGVNCSSSNSGSASCAFGSCSVTCNTTSGYLQCGDACGLPATGTTCNARGVFYTYDALGNVTRQSPCCVP